MSFRFPSTATFCRRLVPVNGHGRLAGRPISQLSHNGGRAGRGLLLAVGGTGLLALGLWASNTFPSKLHAEASQPKDTKKALYTRGDVATHTSADTRVWVTYQDGVYDVTDFAGIHPGGERILLAAGKAIDPYWAVFAIHNSQETKDLLEGYRIGSLLPADKDPTFDPNQAPDPGLASLFANDPERHPSLITRSARPRNAEAAPESLESFITPNALFYVRNHLPVPQVRPEEYSLEIDGPGIPIDQKYSLQDLKDKFPKTEVMATIQCAGNRRAAMHEVKPVKGLLWDLGAIGNAVWAGARLSDVIKDAGYKSQEEIRHVQFNGSDGYGASIPVAKALDPRGDVILAYEMNGEPIPPDHGFPLRVLIPGHVAARSVKWVDRISLSEDESESHWQQKDYKGFSPSANLETSDYSKAESIQALPVQSAITYPKPGSSVVPVSNSKEAGTTTRSILVKGYAWSGGGNGINRVDVSSDGGKTWLDAQLEQNREQGWGQKWAWTKWEAVVPVSSGTETEVICKAVDSAYQAQPEGMEGIYNVRGVLVNAWHRVKVQHDKDAGKKK